MSKDDVTKRFKPVWNLPLALERNIDQQGMEKLQELYNALGNVLDYPHRYPDPVATVERLEYALQNTWKFEEDSKMHRYWNRIKGCTCPQEDNFLALGTGIHYYNSSCKWHGMKMNSNNEQDYRHFKGVGASYESGVVYSHQKLVVSEVQTKTRKYNAARLMRHIGHHFPGGFKITNRTAEGILPFYVLRCESGWTENWTVIDASDTTLATNARNQLVCTAHKVPAADGRVRVHPDSMKRFMATLTDMVAQRDVEITSLPFDVVVYNEIMWERKGGDGATGVPHQDNPGELGEKGTAGDGETRLPNSTVLDQEYDPEEGFDILNRTMWKERKMQTLTDVISLLENSGHLTGWGIRNSRIRGIDFCAWVLFKDVKEVDRLIYRHMKLFDTTELVLGGTLQGAGWRSRNYVENFVFNGKQVCVTLACNGASIAALAVLSQMRRLMYNQMRRLMYNTETRTQIIDSILETHLEDADDETPRVKPPKKSLPAQDAGDYEGN